MTKAMLLKDWLLGFGLEFSAPFLIVALCLVAALGFGCWIWKRHGRRLAVPYDNSSGESGKGWWVAVSMAETLLPVLAGVVLLILCVPLTSGSPVEKRSVSNIQFCVDSSGSMTASFGDGNRYDASMKAINEFLDYRSGDAFGLTFFASSVVHWCPLTSDSSAFKCAIPFMKPDQQRAIGGGTRIGMGLRSCQEVLNERDDGDKMIILVSDGQSGDLSGGKAQEIGRDLQQDNITVFGIHIGGGEVPEEIVTLTAATNGAAFTPGDIQAFEEVFRKIDAMKPAETEVIESDKIDNFRPWCVAGLSSMLLWAVSLFGLRYTPW